MKTLIILVITVLVLTTLFSYLDTRISKLPKDNSIRIWWERNICSSEDHVEIIVVFFV